MEIILTQRAADHIQSQGGRAAVDLLQHSTWAGCAVEVSVDTRVHRRDISAYQSHRLNDVEVLTLPELSRHVVSLQIDLRTFLFLRNLKAVVQLDNGMLIGKSPYGIQRAEAEG